MREEAEGIGGGMVSKQVRIRFPVGRKRLPVMSDAVKNNFPAELLSAFHNVAQRRVLLVLAHLPVQQVFRLRCPTKVLYAIVCAVAVNVIYQRLPFHVRNERFGDTAVDELADTLTPGMENEAGIPA